MSVLRLLVVLGAFGLAAAAGAQTPDGTAVRVEAQVTGVAGTEAFLDRGTVDGIVAGDTVGVERGGAMVGRLAIVQATATRAVATAADAPFALTRGDRVTLVVRDRAAPPPAPVAETPAPSEAPPMRPGLLGAPAASAARAARAVRFTGRVQTGVQALRSTTQPRTDGGAAPGEAIGRLFATPFAALRATVAGLPGGARLHLDGRAAYRYADAPGVDGEAEWRLYHASVTVGETDEASGGARLRAEAGRFVSRHERATGYWDGAQLSVGTAETGVGVAAGFQPLRTNSLPGLETPKLAAFAFLSQQRGSLRTDAAVSGGHLFASPPAGGEGGASFGGAQASVAWREGTASARLGADVLTDASGGAAWGLARASVRANGRAGRISGHTTYSRFRPSALTSALLPVGVAFAPSVRETVAAGAGLRWGRADLRLDGGLYRRDGQPDGTHVGGGVSVARLPGVGLGLALDATRRVRDGLASLYASASLSADAGPARVAGGYRLTQSALALGTLVQHGVEGTVTVPLTPRVGVVVTGGVYRGSGLNRSSLYTSLWYRL